MKKLYFFWLVVFIQFVNLNAQNLTSHELIQLWKISDVTQSLKAEIAHKDLRENFLKPKYASVVKELNDFLKENPDIRLKTRFFIYQLTAKYSIDQKLSAEDEAQLKVFFRKVLELGDKQLLSELYTFYSEQGPGKLEDKLYYKMASTEIQEGIGVRYFPRFHLKYLSLGISYYKIGNFQESIESILKGIKIIEQQKDYSVFEYAMQLDILGASYYELQKIDSGLYYYQKIQNVLQNPHIKKNKYYDINLWEIWNGVSKGGIAKGFILKNQPRKAIPLLISNISSSKKHKQWGDLIKAKNLLAQIYLDQEMYSDAISLYQESFSIAKTLNPINQEAIKAADGLSSVYKIQNRYDSAYYYLQKKLLLQNEYNRQISQSKLDVVNSRLQVEKVENLIKEAERKIQEQRNNRNLILAGSLLIIVLMFLVYNRYRLKQKSKLQNLEVQQKIINLEKQKVENDLKTAQQDIHLFIENSNQKNELIISISQQLEEIKKQQISESNELERTMSQLRNTMIVTDEDWVKFQKDFDTLYFNFTEKLIEQFPSITPSEQRYLMLTKIGLNHKKMAHTLGISNNAVRATWNRVRKKMGGNLEDTPRSLLEKVVC